MKIMSIDVGMKNLAYCIFKVDNDKYEILDWNVVNLCEVVERPICCGLLKNKKPCTKNSKFHKNNKYYCKTHAKKEVFLIPTKELKPKFLKKMKVSNLKVLCIENKYPLPNKPKKIDFLNAISVDLSNNYFNTIENVDSRSINVVTYGQRIKECFTEIMKNTHIDCMIIENQIGPLALRMKMLQGMIMQHFIEVGCVNIKEISPSNKLKEFVTKKTTYNERKKISIKITRELIIEEPHLHKWTPHFDTHKKKDDLADSYLQGLWYIKTFKKS
jgi:hypothetical protein